MLKPSIDNELIKDLLTRGVEKIYPNYEALEKKLKKGERIKLYCGFDPSAKSLHIGNAILLNKLAQFQTLGHEVIFLIGDFTGMIGDPTDKSSTRQKLTRKEVLENARNYKKQASSYLSFSGKNKARVKYNSKWSDKLSFKDLIEISSNFTVQQMIQRNMFQERLKDEKPIYLHEFLYPLAQGYDSVAMDVDLEIGGNDQMFNMITGRDLMKTMKNKEKFVLTMKLLADDSGKKMGKTEGNVVNLDESASDIYGKVMSWTDGMIGIGFELCTKVKKEELEKIYAELKNKETNPRDLKMKLAFEITRIITNDKNAEHAENNFKKTVQNKEIPDEIEKVRLKKDSMGILDILSKTGLASSNGEARRLIKQNGIKVNNEIISDPEKIVNLKEEILIQRGKRQFVKVKK